MASKFGSRWQKSRLRSTLRSWWEEIRSGLRWLWQTRKQHSAVAILVFVGSALGIALIGVVVLGYWLNWHWTGLVPETSEPKQHAKTLWDWLNLLGVLAIPAVVGLGTIWFTRQQAKVSDAENTDNQRETALQAYIDKISELLLHEKLGELKPEQEEVRKVARVRTLTVLPHLDGERKRSLLQFLYESGLLNKDEPIIDLNEADLRGAYLDEAQLKEANLSRAKLMGANLSKANLEGANLHGARYNTKTIQSKDALGNLLTLERTQWPQGFDPKAAGATCIDC